jgi:hypothetical protein
MDPGGCLLVLLRKSGDWGALFCRLDSLGDRPAEDLVAPSEIAGRGAASTGWEASRASKAYKHLRSGSSKRTAGLVLLRDMRRANTGRPFLRRVRAGTRTSL